MDSRYYEDSLSYIFYLAWLKCGRHSFESVIKNLCYTFFFWKIFIFWKLADDYRDFFVQLSTTSFNVCLGGLVFMFLDVSIICFLSFFSLISMFWFVWFTFDRGSIMIHGKYIMYSFSELVIKKMTNLHTLFILKDKLKIFYMES